MPLYIYEAMRSNGQTVSGEMEAENRQVVAEHLANRALTPLKVAEKGKVKKQVGGLALFETINQQDQILLARNLAAGTKAGMSLVEALDILIDDNRKKILRDFLVTAKTNVENGQPLSASFAAYRKYFPPIFVGLVKAGEASGKLDESLEELAKVVTKEYNLKHKIRSALAYPMVLLSASAAAVILLLTFILPKLANTFRQSNVQLPLVTRIFMRFGAALSYSWILDLIILSLLVFFLAYFRKTPIGQKIVIAILFKLPVVSDLAKKASLIRFARSMGNLIQSGIVITEDLSLSADSVGNSAYKKVILEARDQVLTGASLAQTLSKHPNLFPKFLVSLMAVGERTGTLEHILKTVADFYEEDLDSTLKDLSTFIEPILLLLMGLVIGSIAFSILLPIYQLVGKFT